MRRRRRRTLLVETIGQQGCWALQVELEEVGERGRHAARAAGLRASPAGREELARWLVPVRGTQIGSVAGLSQPFDLDELLALVRRYLRPLA